MFKDVNDLLRQAYDAVIVLDDRQRALHLVYQALEISKQTNNRVLRAHVAQCAERVKGTL